jgi:hypothetical protein
MMIITNEFLDENKTPNGSWRKKQLELIGISWPPQKGWKKEVIGKEISDEEAILFSKFKIKEKPKHSNAQTNFNQFQHLIF